MCIVEEEGQRNRCRLAATRWAEWVAGDLCVPRLARPISKRYRIYEARHLDPLVESTWLEEHLQNENSQIFDTTTFLIPVPGVSYRIKNGIEEFQREHIPAASIITTEIWSIPIQVPSWIQPI